MTRPLPLFVLGAAAAAVLGGCAGTTTSGGGTSVTARDSAATIASAAPQAPAPDSVARRLLASVRAADGSIRVESRYATANNFTGAPLPGYEGGAGTALLRREAAAALARVQARLRPEGLGLLVWDGYRPVRATLAMVDWAERTGRADLLDGYIARRSRHNMGVAVDLTLVDLASGQPLDMGTPFDTFDSTAHTANATGAVAANRQRLVRAMEAEGFTNYDQEWWHFTYPVERPVPFDLVIR
ncbi:MAG TPA: M15 family metallopeptidase [Gemmatimonadales bacterium]|nr:M15 family metallopeptidase [Gemmatimonadales bacterium]